jgi:two-component system, OmpR family, phosphate regulon response regulator PhoB
VDDLAAHLARTGVLGRAAAAHALAAARDGDVASAALRLGLAREPALARALAEHHDGPAVDLSKSVVPLANLEALPPAFCRERGVLPVSVFPGELVLAVADPDDHRLTAEVRLLTGRTVLACAAVRAAIDGVLDALERERARGASAWRGPRAPALPDPDAAWVGVVHAGAGAADPAEALGLGTDRGAEPFAAPTAAGRAARAAGAAEDSGPSRLAVVADASAEVRAGAVALLARAGWTGLEAPNGGAALDLVRASRPGLAVLDALLPAIPGFEVCRAVKGDPALRATRVILTSAIPRGPSAADPRAAFGADAFVEKPWRAEELAGAAHALLAGGAADARDAAAREAARGAWREGAALLGAARVEEATVLLREAAAKDDLSAEAHHLLGLALARQGLLFEAAAALARAAELRPDVDAAHEALARVYEALGFRRPARAAWARAVEASAGDRQVALQARLARLLGT